MRPWNEDEDKDLGKGAEIEFRLLLGSAVLAVAVLVVLGALRMIA